MNPWIGVLGYPLTHSLSKQIHEENIKNSHLDWKFRILEWESSTFEKNILELKKDPSCVGFSVTMPFKEKIIPYLDECDDFAKIISSVNCVKNEKGRWLGLNTDAPGFLFHFKQWNPVPPKNITVLFLGAGATARTLSFSLAQLGYSNFMFMNRDREKANQWASCLSSRAEREGSRVSVLKWQSTDFPKENIFILNTTPLGIKSESFDWLEIPKLKPPVWLFDVTYNPPETLLIRQCRSRCFYTMNGWPMFQKQAELAFKYWTAKKHPPRARN